MGGRRAAVAELVTIVAEGRPPSAVLAALDDESSRQRSPRRAGARVAWHCNGILAYD